MHTHTTALTRARDDDPRPRRRYWDQKAKGIDGGGAAAVAGVAAGVGYVASGLGVTKTLINTAEGKESYAGAGVELALESASTFIPYAGPLIDGGEFLYDTIKYNYESGYKISFDSLDSNNE